MKCKCEVWSAGCEECNVKREESVCLALQLRAKQARTGLAGARRMQVLEVVLGSDS